MRSVIFANHGMGDVIMALPLVRAMVSDTKDDALVIVKAKAEADVATLGVTGPGKVRCTALHDLGRSRAMKFSKLMQHLWSHNPEVSFVTYNVNLWLGGVISLLSGATRRIAAQSSQARILFTDRLPVNPDDTSVHHKVEYACEMARLVGRDAQPRVRIPLSQNEVSHLSSRFVGRSFQPRIAIALGSGKTEQHKRLPLTHATRLMRGLIKTFPEVSFVLLGGNAERELNRQLASLKGFRGCNLTGRTSPLELLAVLHRCTLACATCNGVSHMAAAAGCPVVGFFGPTDDRLTGPYGVPLTVIRRNLPCSPCYSPDFIRGCGNPVCMELDVDRAVTTVADYLRDPSTPAVAIA